MNHCGDDVASHGSPTRPSHGPARKSTQCFAARQPFAHRRGWHSDSTAAQFKAWCLLSHAPSNCLHVKEAMRQASPRTSHERQRPPVAGLAAGTRLIGDTAGEPLRRRRGVARLAHQALARTCSQEHPVLCGPAALRISARLEQRQHGSSIPRPGVCCHTPHQTVCRSRGQ